jgi:hypothetical protein
MSLSNLEAIMLFADFENVQGQRALERVVADFVQKLVARLRGDDGQVTSAA